MKLLVLFLCIYNTFNSSTYTQLKGDTVYGTSFALVYFFSTNKLGIINPAADTVTSDGKILFLHHYASINAGLLVDAQQTITDLEKIKTNLANNNYAYVGEQKAIEQKSMSELGVQRYFQQTRETKEEQELLEQMQKELEDEENGY